MKNKTSWRDSLKNLFSFNLFSFNLFGKKNQQNIEQKQLAPEGQTPSSLNEKEIRSTSEGPAEKNLFSSPEKKTEEAQQPAPAVHQEEGPQEEGLQGERLDNTKPEIMQNMEAQERVNIDNTTAKKSSPPSLDKIINKIQPDGNSRILKHRTAFKKPENISPEKETKKPSKDIYSIENLQKLDLEHLDLDESHSFDDPQTRLLNLLDSAVEKENITAVESILNNQEAKISIDHIITLIDEIEDNKDLDEESVKQVVVALCDYGLKSQAINQAASKDQLDQLKEKKRLYTDPQYEKKTQKLEQNITQSSSGKTQESLENTLTTNQPQIAGSSSKTSEENLSSKDPNHNIDDKPALVEKKAEIIGKEYKSNIKNLIKQWENKSQDSNKSQQSNHHKTPRGSSMSH